MPYKKKKVDLGNIQCPDCKYQNHVKNVQRYGTCKLCGKTLDSKAKFEYEMYCRLRLWRKKKGGNKNEKLK